jgi:hypothetical protein
LEARHVEAFEGGATGSGEVDSRAPTKGSAFADGAGLGSTILASGIWMNADQKRRMGMNQGSLAEKMSTHRLVVTKKLHVKPKEREPTAEEMWAAYEKARKDLGIVWCWTVLELAKR